MWHNPYLLWGLLTLGGIGFALCATGIFQQEVFNLGGLPQFVQFFAAILHPDLSAEFLQLASSAALVTLAYAVCGTFFSVLIGLIGGIACSEVWWLIIASQQSHRSGIRSIRLILRAALSIPRAVHEVIWGLFFVNLFGLDPLVGILAIAVPYGAIVAKIFSELLDETPRQPLVALLNSGVRPHTALLYTLFPQACLDLLSYTFYRFECSIRSAAVLGIIGAGGLGYQILLSLQSLRYEQLWTLFFALFLLTGSVDFCSAFLRQRLGSPNRLDLNLRTTQKLPTHRDIKNFPWVLAVLWQHLLLLATIATFLLISFCFWYVHADFSKLWSLRTIALLQEILQNSFPPTLGWKQARLLLELSLQTVAMSTLAITLAGLGGTLLSFPAARTLFLSDGSLNIGKQYRFAQVWAWLRLLLTRSILLISRAIPAPIWALLSLFVLFPGILPGAIALGIHNLGILGRLMTEVNENINQQPSLALKAQGTPASLIFLYGILPTVLTRFLAYIFYRWEVCTRETVIVGLVGAGGLGQVLTEQISSFDYHRITATLSCFVVLTLGVDYISNAARQGLR